MNHSFTVIAPAFLTVNSVAICVSLLHLQVPIRLY